MKHSMSSKSKERRKHVIERLESQLSSKTKPCSDRQDFRYGEQIPLTENDIKRINSELSTLKSRI